RHRLRGRARRAAARVRGARLRGDLPPPRRPGPGPVPRGGRARAAARPARLTRTVPGGSPVYLPMATFMLLPGAGGSGWVWHLVARERTAHGHRAVPVDLPAADDRAGRAEYVDAVVAAVPPGADDLAVVALSMGALSAPLVCERLPVRLLV